MSSSGDIADRVARLIRDQGIRPGERISSERELSETLGVARTALRSALTQLELTGTIRRSMGRTGGIFASDGRLERQINTIEGVPAMLRRQGVSASTRVIRVEVTRAAPHERRALDLAEDDAVARIVRLREADSLPWSVDTSAIPAALVPGITGLDLSDSLYGILESDYGLVPTEAEETITIVAAPGDIAVTLGIDVGEPVLEIVRTAKTADDIAFEFAQDYFRADRTRIQVRRSRPGWKRRRTSSSTSRS